MTTKTELLRVIRKNCIECMGGHESYVKDCTSANCNMYPFRMGKDPTPNATKVALATKNGFQKK